MVYKDLRISIGGLDFQSATRVSLDYPSQISAKRKMGENMKAADQFNFDGPSEVKLSMDFLLNTDDRLNGYYFLFDSGVSLYDSNLSGQRDFNIEVGGLLYQDCFIDDYSINIEPFAPLNGSVNFTCYDPPRGVSITAYSDLDEIDNSNNSDSVLHGYDCSISGVGGVVSSNVVSSIKYTKTFGRTPVYGIGDTNASSFLIDSIEAEMTISSTGLESLLAVSGNEVVNDLVVEMESSDGSKLTPAYTSDTEFKINIPSGSRVVSQNFGVDAGDSVKTNAKIQNVIL